MTLFRPSLPDGRRKLWQGNSGAQAVTIEDVLLGAVTSTAPWMLFNCLTRLCFREKKLVCCNVADVSFYFILFFSCCNRLFSRYIWFPTNAVCFNILRSGRTGRFQLLNITLPGARLLSAEICAVARELLTNTDSLQWGARYIE